MTYSSIIAADEARDALSPLSTSEESNTSRARPTEMSLGEGANDDTEDGAALNDVESSTVGASVDGSVESAQREATDATDIAATEKSDNTNDDDAPTANGDNDNNTTPTPPPTAPAPAETTTKSRFFSRMSSLGSTAASTAAPILGDVYERAQKRAVQLREQAELLRQQQQQAYAAAQSRQQQEFVIPPATGTLVVEPHVIPVGVESTGETAATKDETTINTTPIDEESTTQQQSISRKSSNSSYKSISSPIRDAFNIVKVTSAEVAREYLMPPAADSSDGDEEGDDDSSYAGVSDAASKDAGHKNEEDNTDNTSESNVAGTRRFAAATNAVVSAYTEFRTVGRYRMYKDNEPPQNVTTFHDPNDGDTQTQPLFQTNDPMVGGADRVGGLGRLKLSDIVGMVGSTGGVSGGRAGGSSGELDEEDATSNSTEDRGDEEKTAATELHDGAASISGTVSESTIATALSPKRERPKRGQSYYEDAVKSILQPGQRALFFGKGTMGVILKPTYLASWRGKDGGGLISTITSASKKGGVFIDGLIAGGHAEKSGVVYVGDHVLKIGTTDVSNMTLEEVVMTIAEVERPNIMILTAEHDVETVFVRKKDDVEASTEKYFVSPLDVAFAFVNKIAAEGIDQGRQDRLKNGYEMRAVLSESSLLDAEADDDNDEDSISQHASEKGDDCEEEEEVLFNSQSMDGEDEGAADISATVSIEFKRESDVALFSTPSPSTEDIATLAIYASHRTNGHDQDEQLSLSKGSPRKKQQHPLPVMLERAALFNSEFRTTLYEAFKETCKDPRRCNFLEHFFQNFLSMKEIEIKKRNEHNKRRGVKHYEHQNDKNDAKSSENQQKLLRLYLEMLRFNSAVKVCSESENRETLLEYARSISEGFLGHDELPEYVSYVALGGTENVQSVRRALDDEDEFLDSNGGDGFITIRESLGRFLATQESFLSFLMSDDCARMRAYLRGTTPSLCIGPETFLKPSTIDSDSHNLLLHAILHLVCMKEIRNGSSSSSDDYGDFIKMDAMILNQGEGKRSLGAVSLLSCAVFMMRSLQHSLKAAVEGIIEDGMTGESSNVSQYKQLVSDVQFLWENFIAPASGSLASLTLSDNTQATLDSVRRLLVSSVDGVLDKAQDSHLNFSSLARLFTSSEISGSLHSLCEALLREYTLEVSPNFGRHIFHEWIAKESTDGRFHSLDDSNKLNEYLIKSEYHGLAKGSVKRALRQIELPQGLSLHRPGSISSDDVNMATVPAHLYNADVALVFGTDTEADSSVRRFQCVSLNPGSIEKTLHPEEVPEIFEVYAAVPPFHERPFQAILQDDSNHRMR